ncbi:MAG: tRNA uridine-5-carboxymethylaminomethyl(34) synthesis GTPase MnmE, partial [Candidatus Omnitrophota bacterium]
MKPDQADTIAAISTPPGENGIGIVRLSGPDSLRIADKIFRPKSGEKLSKAKTHSILYGYIFNESKKLDEALLTVMRAPRTYTREDIVEINCHGGIAVLKAVLDLVVSLGARISAPGEFTKRAFLNGRIDLVQAEAVLDIIRSRTEDSLNMAHRQLNGETSDQIRRIRSQLMDIMADIEADINFPDEQLNVSKTSSIGESLLSVKKELQRMLELSDKGIILREGITTVICGKPNVGKSTLMNRFLRHERVIVTPVPGTTRDTIEETVNVKGIPLKIVDTAGIMHAEDELTRESVERSKRYIESADLILLVLDSSDKLSKQDFDIIEIVGARKTLVVVNKTDLPEELQIDEIKKHLRDKKIIRISAKDRSGIEDLEDAIYDMFWSGKITSENILLSNSRHIEAMTRALKFTEDAIKGVDENRPWELLSIDVKDAAEALGIIT